MRLSSRPHDLGRIPGADQGPSRAHGIVHLRHGSTLVGLPISLPVGRGVRLQPGPSHEALRKSPKACQAT
jgi:hypothetical protein